MRCLFQAKTPVNEKRCKDAQMRWLAQFTVCRRGLIHPGFFEKACFFLKPSDIGKHIYVKGPKMKVEHVPVNIDWRFDSAKTRDEHFKDTNDKSITRGSSFEGKLIEVTEPKQGRSFCTIQNDEKCYTFPNPYEKIDPYKYLKEFDITDLSRFQAVSTFWMFGPCTRLLSLLRTRLHFNFWPHILRKPACSHLPSTTDHSQQLEYNPKLLNQDRTF